MTAATFSSLLCCHTVLQPGAFDSIFIYTHANLRHYAVIKKETFQSNIFNYRRQWLRKLIQFHVRYRSAYRWNSLYTYRLSANWMFPRIINYFHDAQDKAIIDTPPKHRKESSSVFRGNFFKFSLSRNLPLPILFFSRSHLPWDVEPLACCMFCYNTDRIHELRLLNRKVSSD